MRALGYPGFATTFRGPAGSRGRGSYPPPHDSTRQQSPGRLSCRRRQADLPRNTALRNAAYGQSVCSAGASPETNPGFWSQGRVSSRHRLMNSPRPSGGCSRQVRFVHQGAGARPLPLCPGSESASRLEWTTAAEPLRFVSVRPPADESFVTGPGVTLCRPESGARRAGRVGRAMALVHHSRPYRPYRFYRQADTCGLLDGEAWRQLCPLGDWEQVLRGASPTPGPIEALRQATRTARPCAEEDVLAEWERRLGCELRAARTGRLPKAAAAAGS